MTDWMASKAVAGTFPAAVRFLTCFGVVQTVLRMHVRENLTSGA